MFKKFISMATAVLVMASGISFVGATAANAAGTVTFRALALKGQMIGVTNVFDSVPVADRNSTNWDVQGGEQSGVEQWLLPEYVSWSPTIVNNKFAVGTVYTASFYIEATYNWNFTGLSSSSFTVAGATSVSVTIIRTDVALVEAVFPATAGGSAPAPSTPAEIAAAAAAQAAAVAAAARAAEAAAAVIRAAEIATAQTSLATVLRGDKAGTLSEYRAANINVTTAASLTRLNAEVLKLSAADRADFAKIKALADRIEFDESFFNATARPSMATYSSYGVTGVTDRILPTINAKVLELPAALRADVKAMQELVKVESFVDRVANTQTRASVSAAVLVSRGLLTAEYPRRHSVVRGLSSYPEGSLNTMAKIEAAIKEQIAKAEAPKRRLAEIRARIAARNK